MNGEMQVSVIVVSRGRPQDLRLCLTSLEQLTHRNFEIVVVADEAGLAVVDDLGWKGRIKTVRVDEANVSVARNAGLVAAAGSVVAFIDDDAVAEPTWLSALTAPFSDRAVSAAAGFVRGRNGISFQWKAKSVDAAGYASDLDVDDGKISVLTPPAGNAIKTVGTNMAFRRDILAAIGGFDPAFRYYLEETDVNFRLAQPGFRHLIRQREPGIVALHGTHERVDHQTQLLLRARQHAEPERTIENQPGERETRPENQRSDEQQPGLDA